MLPHRRCVINHPKPDTILESLHEGKTRRETLRCLKRHIAREAYKLITDPPDVASGADLRRQRTRQGLTIRHTAQALGAAPNPISELERGIIHNSSLAERYQRHLAANPS